MGYEKKRVRVGCYSRKDECNTNNNKKTAKSIASNEALAPGKFRGSEVHATLVLSLDKAFQRLTALLNAKISHHSSTIHH